MKSLNNYINEAQNTIIDSTAVINAIKNVSTKFSTTKSSIGYDCYDYEIDYASVLRYNARSKQPDQIFIFLLKGDVIEVNIHNEPFSTSKKELNDLLKNTDFEYEIKEDSYTSGIASVKVPTTKVFIKDGKKNYVNVIELFANFYVSKIQ